MPSTPPHLSPESSNTTTAAAVTRTDAVPVSAPLETKPSDLVSPPDSPLPPCIPFSMAQGTGDGDQVTVKADEAADCGGEGGRENATQSTVDIDTAGSAPNNPGKVTDNAVVENDDDGEQQVVLTDVAENGEDVDKEEVDAAGHHAKEVQAAANEVQEVAGATSDAAEVAAASDDADGVVAASKNADVRASTSNAGSAAAACSDAKVACQISTVPAESGAPSVDARVHAAKLSDCREANKVDAVVPATAEERENALHQRCDELAAENDVLVRRVARLRQRLHAALDTAQTHGQRLLRAAFQEKVRELTAEHSVKTTQMLNMQKKCFEEELEAMGMDSQMAVREVQRELEVERGLRRESEERYRKERELTLEKTTATMVAVQRKLAQLHARATRLEREKKSLAGAVAEKQVMIEVLASAAAAKDVERRRMELLSRTSEEERLRKEGVVERLETEVRGLREMLAQERKVNANLVARIEEIEEAQGESEKEVKEGKIFAGVGQDFVNAQSDVSTGE
eukprot:GFKZ01005564.1.p1 GENE.GFKZ01005564.1~~GFKZ01005564.1.p1  ORF type:complete len:513 (-),score=134.39 GFKZ01005564.1:3027-4565(-)